MQRWEYYLLGLDYEENQWQDNLGQSGSLAGANLVDWLSSSLKNFGAKGWELVGIESIIHTPSGYYTRTTGCRYIFKRPIER